MSKGRSAGWVLSMALLMALAACDFNDNGYPDVAGTYSGRFQYGHESRDLTHAGSLVVGVRQSGSSVTIQPWVVWAGSGTARPMPDISGTINGTGSIENINGSGLLYSGNTVSCGYARVIRFTIVITGNSLKWNERASQDNCGDQIINAILTDDE